MYVFVYTNSLYSKWEAEDYLTTKPGEKKETRNLRSQGDEGR